MCAKVSGKKELWKHLYTSNIYRHIIYVCQNKNCQVLILNVTSAACIFRPIFDVFFYKYRGFIYLPWKILQKHQKNKLLTKLHQQPFKQLEIEIVLSASEKKNH